MFRVITRYQRLSQARGISKNIVGQAYWHVMMKMLSSVMYMEMVMLTKNGRNRSMLV